MIEVLFFGKMADVIGVRRLALEKVAGESLLVLRDRLFADALAEGRVTTADIRMSVNREVVVAERMLAEGDEVAFFSVFSGG